MNPNSARSAPQRMQLLTSGYSADSASDERSRAIVSNAAAAREKRALEMFERRLKEMSEASARMIDAVVEMRDACAAMQNQ